MNLRPFPFSLLPLRNHYHHNHSSSQSIYPTHTQNFTNHILTNRAENRPRLFVCLTSTGFDICHQNCERV